MIYFIQNTNNKCIKIGVTGNVKARLNMLQTGSADKLNLLLTVDGGAEKEWNLHNKFKQFRIRGEWFSPERPLLEYIKEQGGDIIIPEPMEYIIDWHKRDLEIASSNHYKIMREWMKGTI